MSDRLLPAWLGAVPSHWKVERLKNTVRSCQNGVWGDEPDDIGDVICVRVADFDRLRFRVSLLNPTVRKFDYHAFISHRLSRGHLLLEKSGGGELQPVGAVVLFDHDEPAVYSNFIARLILRRGFDARFMTFVHAACYASGINKRSIKQSTGIQNLDSDSYLNELAAFPPLPEQLAVADFLDRKTFEIDALVARKELLIALLQEKRSALITQSVTKGLDPAAPMKDSGIPWLGELPAHWKIARMGDVFRTLSGGTPDRSVDRFWDGDIPWVSPKDMKRPEITDAEESISDAALRECGLKLIAPGAILVVVRGMILAHSFPVAVTAVPVTINQDMKALVVPPSISCRFAALWLRGTSSVIRGLTVEDAAHGTKAIRQDTWRTLPFPILSIEEQDAIVLSVEEQNAQIDALSGKVSEAIDRLREYRTALVSAAITGKINVGHDRVRPGAADAV